MVADPSTLCSSPEVLLLLQEEPWREGRKGGAPPLVVVPTAVRLFHQHPTGRLPTRRHHPLVVNQFDSLRLFISSAAQV